MQKSMYQVKIRYSQRGNMIFFTREINMTCFSNQSKLTEILKKSFHKLTL